jgi:macrodomain Ter protein organizer (MatP/YcbG family)
LHLYEIRDALKAHFEGEVLKAKKVLDFSDARWSKLGRLTRTTKLSIAEVGIVVHS